MSFASLAEVRRAITQPKARGMTPEWAAKMLHFVPDLPLVKDRLAYLVEKARGRAVLDLGASGPLSQALHQVAAQYWAVDSPTLPPWATQGAVLDLDVAPDALPRYAAVDLVLAGEVLEHLANPGRCLAALAVAYPDRETWITVPSASAYQLLDGTHEMVNGAHVAWYSYTTLSTLLTRYGYPVELARWYGGIPHQAEGLIVRTRTPGGGARD